MKKVKQVFEVTIDITIDEEAEGLMANDQAYVLFGEGELRGFIVSGGKNAKVFALKDRYAVSVREVTAVERAVKKVLE